TYLSRIHASSGIGILKLNRSAVSPKFLLELRAHCEREGGFLTVLQAPAAIKQKIDVWGYPGNALDLMRRIKHQFDPHQLLSPHRFVGGI
ncbi:MAG: FAD-binding oxidoreductase, partial [Cyanothece sp. SIO1E1]|nr:FAD-binding oxidoreductase [Cyanothece sp. SIO1E1]